MSNTSLAVKYRPAEFSDVCGQAVVVKILEKAIETKTFKNAMLFCGNSGCGKTTLARIFANKINDGIGDPIEIDAASNNGVDQVRAIIDSASQRALFGEYKVFIIDECHAITTAGWQAFLKGIEEPNEYTIFIFCTTEPNKLPQTILNRVQRYNLTKIEQPKIKERLEKICAEEGFTNYDETCELISKVCQGGMRDAITYLDQCASLSKDLSLDNVKEILGEFAADGMMDLTYHTLFTKSEKDIIEFFEKLDNGGKDLKVFISNYFAFIMDLIKYSIFKNISLTNIPDFLEVDIEALTRVGTEAEAAALANLHKMSEMVLELKSAMKNDSYAKTTVEVYFLRFMRSI